VLACAGAARRFFVCKQEVTGSIPVGSMGRSAGKRGF
jgi:hypothetical protein